MPARTNGRAAAHPVRFHAGRRGWRGLLLDVYSTLEPIKQYTIVANPFGFAMFDKTTTSSSPGRCARLRSSRSHRKFHSTKACVRGVRGWAAQLPREHVLGWSEGASGGGPGPARGRPWPPHVLERLRLAARACWHFASRELRRSRRH